MTNNISAIRLLDLHEDEIERLAKGDLFITLFRSEENNSNSPVYIDDMLWGRDKLGKSKYALRVISVLKNTYKWIIVVKRLHIQRASYLTVNDEVLENRVPLSSR